MRKTLLFTLLATLLFSANIRAQYCTPSVTCGSFITSLIVYDVTQAVTYQNTTVCSSYVYYLSDTIEFSVTDSYNMEIGSNYTTLSVGTSLPGFAVWVDWDQSGTFEETEAQYVPYTGLVTTGFAFIQVPVDAVPGITRMRIKWTEDHPIPPTLDDAYACAATVGEVEDYNVRVINPIPTTNTPCAGDYSPGSGSTGFCTDSVTLAWTDQGTLPSTFIISAGTNAPDYDNLVDSLNVDSDTSYTLFNLQAATTYGWKVVATNAVTGDATGCPTNVFLTGPGNPTATINPNDPSICAGETIDLDGTPSGGTPFSSGAYDTHTWTSTSSFASATDLQVVTIDEATPGAHEYIYEVVDSLGCAARDTITLTVNESPITSINDGSDTTTFCANTSINLDGIATGGVAPFSFAWTATAGTLTSLNPPVDSLQQYENTNTGTEQINLVITDANGCSSEDSLVAIATTPISPEVELTITPNKATFCTTEAITFLADTSIGDYSTGTFAWRINGNSIAALNNLGSWNTDTLSAGTYTVEVLFTSDACAEPQTVLDLVLFDVEETFETTITDITTDPVDGIICENSTIDLTATHEPAVTGNVDYQWVINGTSVGTAIAYTSNALTQDTIISFIVTPDALCGIADTLSTSIQVLKNEPLTLDFTSNPDVENNDICAGTEVVFDAQVTNAGSLTYDWYINGTKDANTQNTLTTSTLADDDVVKVVVSSDLACATPSSDSAEVTVTVLPVLNPSAILDWTGNPNTTFCDTEEITFTVDTADAGASPDLVWTVDGTEVASNTNTYTTTLTSDANVSFILTPSEVCKSSENATASEDFTINATPDQPTITNNGDGTLTCSPAADSYSWYLNGAPISDNTETITVAEAGNYSVEITNNGCTSPTSEEVNAGPVGIFEKSKNIGLDIYPNPTSGNIVITLDDQLELPELILVQNNIGKTLLKITPSSKQLTLDLSSLENGTYMIHASYQGNKRVQQVIVLK